MNEEEKLIVQEAVEVDGFDYALSNYDFDEVKDPRFHELRLAYVAAAEAVAAYAEVET